MKLNISQAAKAAGVDRSTIQRKIKSGNLSATLDTVGNKLIDPAELERVFGEIAAPDAAPQNEAMPQHATPDLLHLLERQNNDLREQIHVLRQEKEQDRRQHERTVEDLRQDRDAWRTQAEKQTLLLTHAQEKPAQKATLWQRIFA
jgi:choline dehydrogenase-like flavoprotein